MNLAMLLLGPGNLHRSRWYLTFLGGGLILIGLTTLRTALRLGSYLRGRDKVDAEMAIHYFYVAVALALEAALMGSLDTVRRFRTQYLLTNKDLWVAHFIRWKAREMVWTPGMMLDYVVALQRVVEE